MIRKIALNHKCIISKTFSLVLLSFLFISTSHASIKAGCAKIIITPEVGEPSAGFLNRLGKGMEGVIQDLEANALYLDFGLKQYVFCSVDHLGILDHMHQKIIERVKSHDQFKNTEIFISSSHTHSGPGSYIDFPVLGWMLAGKYDKKAVESIICSLTSVIINSSKELTEVELGIGYGFAKGMSSKRDRAATDNLPLYEEISVIKCNKKNGELFSIIFSYATHPCIMGSKNMKFSPDWIGYTRDKIKHENSQDVAVLYINGAQGDVSCTKFSSLNEEDGCIQYGYTIANKVLEIVEGIETVSDVNIKTQKCRYEFLPRINNIPMLLEKQIKSEINLTVIDDKHAFVTIPGELYSSYELFLRREAKQLGYENITIHGITNGAHGYILPVEEWGNSTKKTTSFGGKYYGKELMKKIMFLLQSNRP